MLPVSILLAVVVLVGGAALLFASAQASISTSDTALAKIGMPLGGGKIVSVSVIGGREKKLVAFRLKGDPEIIAKKPVPADEQIKIRVVIKRPGWISWLSGKTQTLTLKYTTPTASSRTHFITLRHGDPLQVHFKTPVEAYEYGPNAKQLKRKVLSSPSSVITLPHTGTAGTMYRGGPDSQVGDLAERGDQLLPGRQQARPRSQTRARARRSSRTTPITISFSKPIGKVLGSRMPSITPATAGSWQKLSSHRIRFMPTGYGYGLDAKVQIALPSGVRLAGGQSGTATSGTWNVPERLDAARPAAAGAGSATCRCTSLTPARAPGRRSPTRRTPPSTRPRARSTGATRTRRSQLKEQWQPGGDGVITKGAIMMFESDHDMTADGVLGPAVWKALITAARHGQKSNFGYTFVMVHEADADETTTLWHNGKMIIVTPANTGTAAAGGTALGTYPVFEHLRVDDDVGHQPGRLDVLDPGILWVSYFNGGDALHYYDRGSYGFPQSDGCVEMPLSAAATIWPYTPIGALVDVST